MADFTTMEKLAMEQNTQYGATLRFGDHVVFTDMYYDGFVCEVYEFIDDPDDGFFDIERRLNLVTRKDKFEDAGHAVKWGLERLTK